MSLYDYDDYVSDIERGNRLGGVCVCGNPRARGSDRCSSCGSVCFQCGQRLIHPSRTLRGPHSGVLFCGIRCARDYGFYEDWS